MPITTKYPTTDTAVSGGWINPTNVQASDGAVASITISQRNRSNDREQGNYGFEADIPGNAIINSVTIEVRHRVSSTSNIAFLENLAIVNGINSTVNSDATEPVTLTARSYLISKPGTGSWVSSDLINANFKTRIRQRNGNSNSNYRSEWDYIRVTVDWTPASGSTSGPLDPGSIWVDSIIHYQGGFD